MKEKRCFDCQTIFSPNAPNHIRCGLAKEKTGCSYERRLKKDRERARSEHRKNWKRKRSKTNKYREWAKEYMRKYRRRIKDLKALQDNK